MNVSSLTASSSSTKTSSYSSSGLSGLMSGMDTESMVKKMLSGTQTKIDSQKQKKQQLEWKQDSYRTCITTINSLYSSYFNSSYDADITNNLASSKFFNQKAAVSSASNVKVISTDTTAQMGDMSVIVTQLATKASLTSTNQMSGDRTITGAALTDDMLASFQKTVSLNVNGTDISVDLNSANTQDEIVAAFNAALKDKGVTASVSSGKLTLTAADSATTISVNKDSSTTLGLTASGLSAGGSASTTTSGTTALKGTDMTPAAGVSLQLSFDGVTKTLTLNDIASDADGKITAKNLLSSLQQELRTAYGKDVSAKLTEDGALQFFIAAGDGSQGHELKIYGSGDTPLASSLGITPGASSSINTSTKLSTLAGISGDNYAFSINGVKFSFTADNTLSDVISTINSSKAGVQIGYSTLSDTFTMTSTSTGAGNTFSIDETSDGTSGNLMTTLFGSLTPTAGKDAQLTVNGVDITRSSNSFTLDGITMQVTAVSTNNGTAENPSYEAATLTTTQDADSIVSALQAFVKDYNTMVDAFQSLLTEDAEYKDYAPLTDEQQSDMSDSEITKWTEKAKTGLLRGDDELTSFLSNMRSALYTKSSSSDVALYDIGIETYDKTGKLTLDESALRKAIAADPEGVANLFTDSTDGISKKMMTAMDSAAKLSVGTPGSLVTLAGDKSLTSTLTNNTIYKQMKDIDDKVDQLQDRYDNEKDRYWSMFNAMETAMSGYNTQMSLLNSYFSSSS